MPWNFKKEIRRKSVHLLAIFFIVIFVLISVNFGKSLALLSLVLLLIIFLELDYVRVELGKKIPLISGLWRTKEKNSHGGQVFFLIGAIISLAAFDFNIAITAILMTVFGDMAAALVGKRFGKIWITKDRTLEGILAELIINLIIASAIIGIGNYRWVIVLVMSITATVVESAVSKLDDNLVIPVFSGFNGQIAKYILNIRF